MVSTILQPPPEKKPHEDQTPEEKPQESQPQNKENVFPSTLQSKGINISFNFYKE